MNPRYLKMVKGMQAENKNGHSKKKIEPWYVYILRCGDNSFYTGITKDVNRRIEKHNSGTGAAYTRTHLPVKLIYQETCRDKTSALIREIRVKSLSRKKKEELVENIDSEKHQVLGKMQSLLSKSKLKEYSRWNRMTKLAEKLKKEIES